MSVQPDVKTFLIADHVIQEHGTRKWSAIGIFDHIYASKFPYVHPHLALYIRLSDADGEYEIRVEFADGEDKRLGVFEGLKLKVGSKLSNPDFGIQTQQLLIPKPGRHSFKLFLNGEFVQSSPLIVVERKKESN